MKILVIKSSALGDIIHSFDLIVYLKKKFPNCQLDWVVEGKFSDLVTRQPLINHVYTIHSKEWRKNPLAYFRERSALRKEKYDLLFDLQGNLKSSLVALAARAKVKVGFGRKSVPEWPNLFFTTRRFNPPKGQNIRADYLFLAQKYFEDFTVPTEKAPLLKLTEDEKKVLANLPSQGVLVAPHSFWPNKEVSDPELLAYLHKLQKEGAASFLLTWKGEKEKKRMLHLQEQLSSTLLLPELSIPLLQHLIERSSLVVAVDSLILHLAATTNTATVSFFGPSSAKKYAPLGKQHTVYQGKCPYGELFEKRCRFLRTCAKATCCIVDSKD